MSYRNAFRMCVAAILFTFVLHGYSVYDRFQQDNKIIQLEEKLEKTENDLAKERSLSESLDMQIEYLSSRLKSSESALQREKTANRASRSRPATHTHRIAPSQDINLAALRKCENSGRYTSKPGDYYRGAYQFDRRTWDGVAERHNVRWRGIDPAIAPPSTQDQFARWLYSERGRQPWPTCGKFL